ncbi:hypothetical protein HYS00_04805 [Candidatus Microgenomates bacterium]|nr:hypothetical protein [Candidatus Microgenomates bacterium]
MRAIIFAGGVGTRLWPMSRKKSPKQFEKVIGEKSTLQLTVERLLPEFKPEDIYISTGLAYIDMVHAQLPFIPRDNIIGEPVKRDVGPAVAYAVSYIAKQSGNNEPVVILWSDHLVRHVKKFKDILMAAGNTVKQEENKMIFIGQKARFASDNLGWIHFGKALKTENHIQLHSFEGFKYKPSKEVADDYFANHQKYCWNLGYFVATPAFLMSLFKRFVPDISQISTTICDAYGTPEYLDVLKKEYEKMPVINFDNALLEQLPKESAYVICEDIGWSDIGAWEALKEALEQKREDNVTNGRVMLEESVDNLVYNYESDKLIVGIDLDNLLVVNTGDVLLVARKTSVGKIKTLVENFQGTENENLT